MGGLTTWAAFPGTEIYQTEVNWFGIPLLIATLGAIVTGWFERRGPRAFRRLRCCAGALRHRRRDLSDGDLRHGCAQLRRHPFVPIGVAFAATAGSAMILELTRRVAGLALVIITGVFLVYTFTAHLCPASSPFRTPTPGSGSSAMSIPTPGSSGRRRRCRRPTSSSSSSLPPSCRPRKSATISSTSPSPPQAARVAVRPRWPFSPPA
jgi:hypothetical protein